MKPNEIVNMVADLNEKVIGIVHYKLYDKGIEPFNYITNGYCHSIDFFNIQLWNSENDEREYINEGTDLEDYEPLEDFIIREANKICTLIGEIKL